MKCEDLINELSPLIDGELDENRSHEWHEHIGSCARCRSVMEQHSRVDALISGIALKTPAPLNPLGLVQRQRRAVLKLAMSGAAFIVLCLIFLLLPSKSLYERYISGTAPHEEINYYVSFNESEYQLSVTGEEVRLVSFEISENGSGSVNMSFEDDEHDKEEEKDEKDDSFIDTHYLAVLCSALPGGRREEEA